MKTLQIALLFALVLQSFGQMQGFQRRRRPIKTTQAPATTNGGKPKTVSTDPVQPKPVVKSSVQPKPAVKPSILPKPVNTVAVQPDLGINNQLNPDIQSVVPEAMGSPGFDGANIPLSELPQWVRDIEGRTVSGTALGLPETGIGGLGAGHDFSSGLRDGWGADPNAPMPISVREWINPSSGRPNRFQREMLPQGAAATRPGGVGHTSDPNAPMPRSLREWINPSSGRPNRFQREMLIQGTAATRLGGVGQTIGSVDTVGPATRIDSQFGLPRFDTFVPDPSVGGFVPGRSFQNDPFGTAGRLPFDIPNSAGPGGHRLASVGPGTLGGSVNLSGSEAIRTGFGIPQYTGDAGINPMGPEIGIQRPVGFRDFNPADRFGIFGDRFRAGGSMVQGIGAVPGMPGGRSFANRGGVDIYGNRRIR